MPYFTNTDKSKIRFHFSQVFSSFINFTEIFSYSYNSIELGYVQNAIANCEITYLQTAPAGGFLEDVEQEVTDQNIVVTSELTSSTTTYGDRVKTIKRRPSYQERRNNYVSEVEKLALMLGVDYG